MSTEAKPKVERGEFTELPVKLPPVLMAMICYPASARYVALYYSGSKATWNDGLGLATFSFYSVFQPLTSHPALAVHLFDANLGSDDEMPTHALLCDREARTFLVGEWEKALRFIHQQHTGEITEEVAAEYRRDEDDPTTGADFNRLGMFELFTRPSEQAQAQTGQLLGWLDSFITEELTISLRKMLDGHDLRAMMPLEYIRRWFLTQLLTQARAVIAPVEPDDLQILDGVKFKFRATWTSIEKATEDTASLETNPRVRIVMAYKPENEAEGVIAVEFVLKDEEGKEDGE